MSLLTRRTALILVSYNSKISPNPVRLLSKYFDTESSKQESRFYTACYRTLELDPDSSQDLVRRQYIRLVKKFHPDSAKSDSERDVFQKEFHKVDQAYRELQKKFIADRKREEACSGEFGLYYENRNDPDVDDDDSDPDFVKHRAPQHRHFLSNEGYGYGTPSQRQSQYQKMRAARAIDNVNEHRVSKIGGSYEDRLVSSQRKAVKKQRAQNAIERLVEDLIVDAMAKGEFENLKGTGKPLPDRVIYNPYEDFTTHKLNQILAEGGFAPEWIMLKRDIEGEKQKIRDETQVKAESIFSRQNLNSRERTDWNQFLLGMKDKRVKKLNVDIDKFNLIVPLLNSQMLHFNLDKEAEKISQAVIAKASDDRKEFRSEDGCNEVADSKPSFVVDIINNFFFNRK